LRELGSLTGIIGVKYAVGGIDAQTVELFADLPAEFDVLIGDDVVVGPAFAIGASGGILACANVVTAPFVELHQAWRRGELARARELGGKLGRLAGALFAEPNPTVIKGVLHATGRIPTADVRLPLVPASQDSVDAALKLLAELGQTQSQ
jgi:4-hydroxy-tetrahydrodipicolinate synthase